LIVSRMVAGWARGSWSLVGRALAIIPSAVERIGAPPGGVGPRSICGLAASLAHVIWRGVPSAPGESVLIRQLRTTVTSTTRNDAGDVA
jgi:hypothetical protein